MNLVVEQYKQEQEQIIIITLIQQTLYYIKNRM